MLKFILSVVIVSVLAAGFFDYYVTSLVTGNEAPQKFVIKGAAEGSDHDSLFDIGEKLETEELLPSRYYFYYYAWRHNLRGKMFAGEYVIPARTDISKMVYFFSKGDVVEEERAEISVTFPEGWTIGKMANRLTEKGFSGEEFEKMALNPSQDVLAAYPFIPEKTSLEGYLFPDTYNFFAETTTEEIIQKMLTNFDRKISSSMRDQIAAQGKTLHDVIILASVVEGEVNEGLDRDIVAGIFYNRLDINMALQSDATIDYIKGKAEIKHTLEDIAIDSPYNTYKYAGLPAGPINSPSLKSITAVMHPQETEYFFFLNNAETGETVFSKTFDEHIANKAKNGL